MRFYFDIDDAVFRQEDGIDFKAYITTEVIASVADWFIDKETSCDYYSSVRASVDNIIKEHKKDIIDSVINNVTEKIMAQKSILAMKPKASELAAADKENVAYFEQMIEKAIARKFS